MNRAFDFVQKLVLTFGTTMRRYGEDLSGLEDFDGGLRSRIFKKTDTAALAGFLREWKSR